MKYSVRSEAAASHRIPLGGSYTACSPTTTRTCSRALFGLTNFSTLITVVADERPSQVFYTLLLKARLELQKHDLPARQSKQCEVIESAYHSSGPALSKALLLRTMITGCYCGHHREHGHFVDRQLVTKHSRLLRPCRGVHRERGKCDVPRSRSCDGRILIRST